jgi:hypothetical protein
VVVLDKRKKTCKRAELHSYKAKTKFTEREKHPIYKEKRSNTFVSNLYFSNVCDEQNVS